MGGLEDPKEGLPMLSRCVNKSPNGDVSFDFLQLSGDVYGWLVLLGGRMGGLAWGLYWEGFWRLVFGLCRCYCWATRFVRDYF